MCVCRFHDMGSIKGLFELNKVKLWRFLNTCHTLKIGVVLEPLMQVVFGVFFNQLIGTTNSKHHQRIEVVRIDFMSHFERNNGVVVLIVLLIELTHKSPCLRVLRISLDFSFQAQDSLLNSTLFN